MLPTQVRILPVIAPLPAIYGNAIAAHVLTELAGQPMSPAAMEAVGPKQYVSPTGVSSPVIVSNAYIGFVMANYGVLLAV